MKKQTNSQIITLLLFLFLSVNLRLNAQIITTVAGNGNLGNTGNGGQATLASLDSPVDVAVDAAGNLYIAESGGGIRKVTPAGVISSLIPPPLPLTPVYPITSIAVSPSGEVYFVNSKGEERALDKGFIQKIIFYKDNDTSAIGKNYISDNALLAKNEYSNPFMEVLNNGKYALLKRTIKDVRSADSMFGTQKRFYFASTVKYYLLSDKKIEPLNKLTKESITASLPNSSRCEEWLKQNKINFKKVADIILFLNYYNSLFQ